jgi:hypothetical protein
MEVRICESANPRKEKGNLSKYRRGKRNGKNKLGRYKGEGNPEAGNGLNTMASKQCVWFMNQST